MALILNLTLILIPRIKFVYLGFTGHEIITRQCFNVFKVKWWSVILKYERFWTLFSLVKSLPIYNCDQTHVACYFIWMLQKFQFFEIYYGGLYCAIIVHGASTLFWKISFSWKWTFLFECSQKIYHVSRFSRVMTALWNPNPDRNFTLHVYSLQHSAHGDIPF